VSAELENQLHDPAVATNPAKLVAITKEQGKLKAVVLNYRSYKKLLSDIEQTNAIVSDEKSENEMKALAGEELKQLEGKKFDVVVIMGDSRSC
jgi:peptide chain release factor 1